MRRALWWQAALLGLGPASALGFARFAYGLFVPAMRQELGWSMAEAGGLTTANGLGYLAGALVTARLVRRCGLTGAYRGGMVLAALALAATAGSGAYPALLGTRAVAGFAGALVFVSGGVLAARLATRNGAPGLIPVYFAGAGAGVALSGFGIPLLLAGAAHRWALGWLALAVATALATLASWQAAREGADTEDRVRTGAEDRARTDAAASPPPPASGRAAPHSLRAWWRIAGCYTLFGAGYIAYLTFLSVYLTSRHASLAMVVSTWVLIGLAATVAPLLWRRPLAAWRGPQGLAVLLFAVVAAALLPLFGSGRPVVIGSALVFGVTFMMVPSAVTAMVSAVTPAREATGLLASLTVAFAIGQTFGPWLSGLVADRTGPAASLVWTAVLSALAATLVVARPARRAAMRRI